MNEVREVELLMETSWEVCNKVGGIYTVLSSRAATMIEKHGHDRVLFIGPLLESSAATFTDYDVSESRKLTKKCAMEVRVGRWNIPGAPKVALIDFRPLYDQKASLYYEIWSHYGIRSDLGYGDYDQSSLFALAAAKLMDVYFKERKVSNCIAIFNEWTTAMGLLYIKLHEKNIKTIFITHATTVGRSIAGNGKPLYAELFNYDGDQMANELGVVCKHALEKSAAHQADLFATVSNVTAKEAKQLLEKEPDAILYNGFELTLVPEHEERAALRTKVRQKIIHIAEAMYGCAISKDAVIIATSGRQEYRNKGLDIFINALARTSGCVNQDIVALIAVPGWVEGVRKDVKAALNSEKELTMPMQYPFMVHELNALWENQVFTQLNNLRNYWGCGLFPLFVADYLHGHDGALNFSYYDFLSGIDLTIFASYYEPWGYTPLESIAFGVPTITTDKSGFGLWTMSEGAGNDLSSGVKVLHRDDYNSDDISKELAEALLDYSNRNKNEQTLAKMSALALAMKAQWTEFYPHYLNAYKLILGEE